MRATVPPIRGVVVRGVSMPRATDEVQIVPSVLDRLLDDTSEATPAEQYHGIRDLKRVVGRDLEALLNTRQETLEQVPSDLTETSRSILTYGLPDFSSLSLGSQEDRDHVRRTLEQAIATFEPRLDGVRVIIDDPRPFDRGLHFRIEAVLLVHPAPEAVTFDAMLQLTTQEYRIQGLD
jgi:type VI secretion system protein ImpF